MQIHQIIGPARILFFVYFFVLHCSSVTMEAETEMARQSNRTDCNATGFHLTGLCPEEVAILEAATQHPAFKAQISIEAEDFRNLTEQSNIDLATAIFFQRVNRQSMSDAYIRRIDTIVRRTQIEGLPDYSDRNVLLAMVPGMFYTLNTSIGGDGRQIRESAEKLGMQSHLILMEPDGSLDENAQYLCDWLQKTTAEKIILASISKGGSDIKRAIQLCADSSGMRKVRAWLNIGGIMRGSHLINEIDEHWSTRWRAKTFFWKYGFDYDALLSVRVYPGSPLLLPMRIPAHMRVINVIAVPLQMHVTNRARESHALLSRHGPNDGLALLTYAYLPGAINFAWWGNDHYFAGQNNREEYLFAGLIEIMEQMHTLH